MAKREKAVVAVATEESKKGGKREGGKTKAVGVPRYAIRRVLRNFIRENTRCVFDKKAYDLIYQSVKLYTNSVFANALSSMKDYRKAPKSLNRDRLAIAASRVRLSSIISKLTL